MMKENNNHEGSSAVLITPPSGSTGVRPNQYLLLAYASRYIHQSTKCSELAAFHCKDSSKTMVIQKL